MPEQPRPRSRRDTLPGLGYDCLTTEEARALWHVVEALARRVAELETRAPKTSAPPPGVVELQGPSGLRLRGAGWLVLALAALALGGVVAWRWAPSSVPPGPPQTHGGR